MCVWRAEGIERLRTSLHVVANRTGSATDINGHRFLVRPARNVVTILTMLRQNSHNVLRIQYFRWWNSGGQWETGSQCEKIRGRILANYFCSFPSPPPLQWTVQGLQPGIFFHFFSVSCPPHSIPALSIYYISSSSLIFSLHLAFTRLFLHFFLPKPSPFFSRNPPSISSLSVFFQSGSLFVLYHSKYTCIALLVFHTVFYSTVNILPAFYLSIFTFWAVLFYLFSLSICFCLQALFSQYCWDPYVSMRSCLYHYYVTWIKNVYTARW
jgi:hypothetical protein